MSRREIAINTLLGVVLILIFALPFVLGVFALGFVFQAVDLA